MSFANAMQFAIVLLGAQCVCQILSSTSSSPSLVPTPLNSNDIVPPPLIVAQTEITTSAVSSSPLATSQLRSIASSPPVHDITTEVISESSQWVDKSTDPVRSCTSEFEPYRETILKPTNNIISSSSSAPAQVPGRPDAVEVITALSLSSLSATIAHVSEFTVPSVTPQSAYDLSFAIQLSSPESTMIAGDWTSGFVSHHNTLTTSKVQEARPPHMASSQENVPNQVLTSNTGPTKTLVHGRPGPVNIEPTEFSFTEFGLGTGTRNAPTAQPPDQLEPEVSTKVSYQRDMTRDDNAELDIPTLTRMVVSLTTEHGIKYRTHATDHTADESIKNIAKSTTEPAIQNPSPNNPMVDIYSPKKSTTLRAMLFDSSISIEDAPSLSTQTPSRRSSPPPIETTPMDKMQEVLLVLPTRSLSVTISSKEARETSSSFLGPIPAAPTDFPTGVKASTSLDAMEDAKAPSSTSVLFIDLDPRPNTSAAIDLSSTSTSLLQDPTDWLPTAILTETEVLGAHPTGTPEEKDLPLAIRPRSDGQDPLDSMPLFYLGFRYPLNYEFVASTPVAAVQIFRLLPQLFLYSDDSSAITVIELIPYDTKKELDYITTIAKLYFPNGDEQLASHDLGNIGAWQYNAKNETLKDLVDLIDPQSDYKDNSQSNAEMTSTQDQDKHSSHLKVTVASAVVGGCVLLVGTSVGVFLGLRRYKINKCTRSRPVYSIKRIDGTSDRAFQSSSDEYHNRNKLKVRDMA